MKRHKATVLIVDDDKEIRNGLAETILRKSNFKILTAENGKEALRVLTNNNVDVVLTDICMPKLNGNVFAEHIKSVDPTLQIVGMSGYCDLTEDQLFLDGIDHFFAKPFEVDQLISILTELANNRSFALKNTVA